MLTPTTTAAAARLVGSRGLQLPSSIAYSSPLASLARQPCSMRTPSRQISTAIPFQPTARKATTTFTCQFAARRSASTTASATSTPSTTPKLDWNSFFQLRKTRRRFQLASSIVTMVVGGTGGALLLVNVNMDWLLSKAPIDPIFALGIITLSFAGLGWLAGPSVGSAIFYSLKSGVKKPMGIKESEFFNRIKKNRVDPSNSSLSGNAVPDFYGEKISSVAGYRQWLKDQRAFNKKRTSFI
ncbi:Pam17-domain-containing protein [Astrocystis sublimbata]|nr:Pam17-domain-containing protein [Astrocystis sublimbata]